MGVRRAKHDGQNPRWGCRPMARTVGSQGGEPVRPQAALCASIAQSPADRWMRSAEGPTSAVSP